MPTKLMATHYILEGHKLNTDQPEKISLQLLCLSYKTFPGEKVVFLSEL